MQIDNSNYPYQGDVVKTSGTQKIEGNLQLQQGELDLGRNDSNPVSPAINFHTSQTPSDYDVQIKVSKDTNNLYHYGSSNYYFDTTVTVSYNDINLKPILKVEDGSTTQNIIQTQTEDGFGISLLIQGGGGTFVGSGESAVSYKSTVDPLTTGYEHLYLTSDQTTKIVTGCQTITNRKEWTFNSNGTITAPNGRLIAPEFINISGNAYNVTLNSWIVALSTAFNTAFGQPTPPNSIWYPTFARLIIGGTTYWGTLIVSDWNTGSGRYEFYFFEENGNIFHLKGNSPTLLPSATYSNTTIQLTSTSGSFNAPNPNSYTTLTPGAGNIYTAPRNGFIYWKGNNPGRYQSTYFYMRNNSSSAWVEMAAGVAVDYATIIGTTTPIKEGQQCYCTGAFEYRFHELA